MHWAANTMLAQVAWNKISPALIPPSLSFVLALYLLLFSLFSFLLSNSQSILIMYLLGRFSLFFGIRVSGNLPLVFIIVCMCYGICFEAITLNMLVIPAFVFSSNHSPNYFFQISSRGIDKGMKSQRIHGNETIPFLLTKVLFLYLSGVTYITKRFWTIQRDYLSNELTLLSIAWVTYSQVTLQTRVHSVQ